VPVLFLIIIYKTVFHQEPSKLPPRQQDKPKREDVIPLKYPDAIGYLYVLAKEVGEEWFTMICDLAVVDGRSTLDQQNIETLFTLFRKSSCYLGIRSSKAQTNPITVATSTDYLETLSDFSDFKLLQSTLQITFKKRITLVFGSNGSGKSSLCDSLKVLSCPDMPNRPIHNVRSTATTVPKFNYKFTSDTVVQIWTQTVGYGPRSSAVKYFDAGVAVRNVKDAVEPSRVIELTPFKLHIFECVKSLTSKFRETLQKAELDNASRLERALVEIQSIFAAFKARPLALINEKTLSSVVMEIKIGDAFSQSDILMEKQAAAADLEKAASEEGLKLLKAEHRELDAFLSSIGIIIDSAEGLCILNPVAKVKELASKQEAQELLAKTLIPENGTLDNLLSLLRIASLLCNLEEASNQNCPLCKRELLEPEAKLFKHYHNLLSGDLEKEIKTLRSDITKAGDFVKTIGAVNRNEWDKSSTLSEDMLSSAKTNSDLIICNCGIEKELTEETLKSIADLKALSVKGKQLLEQKANAIIAATTGRDELVKQLAKLHGEIEPLEYAQLIAAHLGALSDLEQMANEAAFWNSKLPSFTQLFRKITGTSKEAHDELIVSDFETHLNSEYKALTEKPMAAFGVTIAKIGSDASVTLLPKVGRSEIDGVLSEGEQRIHALALFFAELESSPQSVIIFDDPISSFGGFKRNQLGEMLKF